MSGTFLDKIIEAKRHRLALQIREVGSSGVVKSAISLQRTAEKHRLRSVLEKPGINIIAEFKRASPSKGVINDRIDIRDVVKQYKNGGAAAISVLTEEDFFAGSLDDLRAVRETIELPILRKDFIIDEFQIYESAASGADAILLIVAALSDDELRAFLRVARDELGLDAIVEVHDERELETAAGVGADIIGVNNRNLRSFEVSLDTSGRLVQNRPDGALMISESGLSSGEQIQELHKLGFDGFLIGESLMRSDDAEGELRRLVMEITKI